MRTAHSASASFSPLPPPPPTPPPPWLDTFCSGGAAVGTAALGGALGIGGFIHGGAEGGALAGFSQATGGLGLAFGFAGIACAVTHNSGTALVHRTCVGLNLLATGAGAVTLITGWTGIGGIIGGVSSMALGIAGNIVCASDPPDPNFRVIARPRGVRFRIARTGLRMPRAVRAQLTGLGQNGYTVDAVGKAMILCINRASGAEKAGDSEWRAVQRQCAARYAGQLANLMETQKGIRTALVRALRGAGVSNPSITRTRVQRETSSLKRTTERVLEKLGASHREIAFTRSHIDKAIALLPRSARALDLIAGPRTQRALDDAAAAFRAIAAQYR